MFNEFGLKVNRLSVIPILYTLRYVYNIMLYVYFEKNLPWFYFKTIIFFHFGLNQIVKHVFKHKCMSYDLTNCFYPI